MVAKRKNNVTCYMLPTKNEYLPNLEQKPPIGSLSTLLLHSHCIYQTAKPGTLVTKLFWPHSLQIYLQDNSCSRHKTAFNKHSANELINKTPQEQVGKTQQGRRTNLLQ